MEFRVDIMFYAHFKTCDLTVNHLVTGHIFTRVYWLSSINKSKYVNNHGIRT